MNEEYVEMLEERICKLEVQLEQLTPKGGSLKHLLNRLQHDFNTFRNKYDDISKSKQKYISSLISYYEAISDTLEQKKLNQLKNKRNKYKKNKNHITIK